MSDEKTEMILQAITSLCLGLAAVAWVVAVVSVFGMLRHTEKGRSVWWFATNGYAFFTGTGFTAGAAPYRRRFGIAVGCFALFIGLGAVAGIVLSGQ